MLCAYGCDDPYLLAMQELVNELGTNGAFTGTLAADSSNVVTLVRDLYNVSKKKIALDLIF